MRGSLAILTALALASAAPAAAAPARSHTFDKDHLTDYSWTFGPATGFVVTSAVGSRVACTAPVQTCDFTLIKLDDRGTLTVDTSSADQTLVDIDLHLYTSDADGTQGDSLANSTGGTPTEAVGGDDLDPGYYLVKVDYFAGYGSYTGHATFTPTPPEDEQPE